MLEKGTNRAVGAKVGPPDFLSIFTLLKQSKTKKLHQVILNGRFAASSPALEGKLDFALNVPQILLLNLFLHSQFCHILFISSFLFVIET